MKLQDIELPSNRSFGMFFSFIFFVIGIFLFFQDRYILFILFEILVILIFGISILRPHKLLPFNKLWMRFGIFIGKIVSPVVIGIIFFLVFSPTGVLMRIFGRDELRLKKRDLPSYWKVRNSTEISPESFRNQF